MDRATRAGKSMETLDAALNIVFLPLYIFIVLTLHELGHYATARFFNISVESFSLGYGDELWSRTDKRGTHWIVRLFPICGHVHLAAKKNEARGVLFFDAPPWQRAVVVSAGPAINIITAFLFLFIFFALFGQPAKHPVLAGVEPAGAAYEAGLRTGDRIIEVDGAITRRYHEVWTQTYRRPGQALNIKFLREGKAYETSMTPKLSEYTSIDGIEKAHGRMGVIVGRAFMDLRILESINGIPIGHDETGKARALLVENLDKEITLGLKSVDGERHDYLTVLTRGNNAHLLDPLHKEYGSFYAGPLKDNFYLKLDVTYSLIEAGKETGRLLTGVAKIPFQLFPVDKEMIQPLAQVADESQFAKRKFYEFCHRVALVSILIALINLVPFPGLDGSLLLLTVLQGAMGKENEAGTRAYKYVLLASLTVLYGSIVMANASDFPHHMHRKMAEIGVIRP